MGINVLSDCSRLDETRHINVSSFVGRNPLNAPDISLSDFNLTITDAPWNITPSIDDWLFGCVIWSKIKIVCCLIE
jgi:hypothetical protein